MVAWCRVALATILLAAFTGSAKADDDALARRSLKGIKGFLVIVTVDEDLQAAGLDSGRVLTIVELKLRQAGIKVLTEKEYIVMVPVAALAVGAQGVPNAKENKEITQYGVRINLDVGQLVTLSRDPKIQTYGVTWSTGFVGTYGSKRVGDLADEVGDLMDQLLNAYLAANPKPPTVK